MELEVINKALTDRIDVINVKVIDETVYKEHSYQILIKCDLIVAENAIPIIIAIPQNWKIDLIDIFIQENMDFPFIPHIDVKGKICLFELEGVLIDQNLSGIVTQSLDRAKQIIQEGFTGVNKQDFINEFASYWKQLPHIRRAKFELPNCNHITLIKYSEKAIERKKKEPYLIFLQRSKLQTIYISKKPQNLRKYYLNSEVISIKNAVYINIKIDYFLFPPDPRNEISKEYIQNLLSFVNISKYQAIMSKIGRDKLLVFSIEQPNGVIVLLGFLLEKCKISTESGICTLESVNQIFPLSIDRIDKQYLMTRSNEVRNLLSEKKVLLIGCGSLGGYIANELVRAGIENMMLVDADHLYEVNIFRHLLGLEYIGQYKCVALQRYLETNIPDLKITSLAENIEEAVQEGEIEFQQYDVIISATGIHNINRWINQFVYERKIDVPVVYAWNEALGIGNHVAYIKYDNIGCYDCFIGRNDDTGEVYDRTSYCKSGQDVVRKVAGCGNSFIPYGSTVSLKTAAICVDTVKKLFDRRYNNNIIISAKGDDYYFTKAGLQVSNKYLNQKDSIVEYGGDLFAKADCKCCGVNYGDSE